MLRAETERPDNTLIFVNRPDSFRRMCEPNLGPDNAKVCPSVCLR
jgi:hypothetical protein